MMLSITLLRILAAVLGTVLLSPSIPQVAASPPNAVRLAETQPIASYDLPPRSDHQTGACRLAADASHAVVGFPWGGKSPFSGGFDHGCRGFRLITLRTGASRVVVQLPTSEQKALWEVDEPSLAGNWLVYMHTISLPYEDWQIVALNLGTGRSTILDRRQAAGILDDGWVTTAGQTVIWMKGTRDAAGNVTYRVHAYNLSKAKDVIVTSAPPLAPNAPVTLPFIGDRLSGSILVFLRKTAHGTDIWMKDLRTGHLRALTHTGDASVPVITGPWVAWNVDRQNGTGPLMLADLRTGAVRAADQQATTNLSAGDGRLTWYEDRANRSIVLDLVTGQRWKAPNVAHVQDQPSLSYAHGHLLIEIARHTISQITSLARVVVYARRSLPHLPPT